MTKTDGAPPSSKQGEIANDPVALDGADAPDVSIVVISASSEKYIRRCARSILSQVGEFTYEVVMLNAGADDATIDIAQEEFREAPRSAFRMEHGPGQIVDGSAFAGLCAGLLGRYTAFIAAEDEWVSPTKLKSQIDFLERHRECYGCVSNYLIRNPATGRYRPRITEGTEASFASAGTLIRDSLVWSISASMFRTSGLKSAQLGATPLDHLAWVASLQLATTGVLGVQQQIMTAVNEQGEHTEAAAGEASRAQLLAQLRAYDQLTGGAFQEDFKALAQELRSEIAEGAPWL